MHFYLPATDAPLNEGLSFGRYFASELKSSLNTSGIGGLTVSARGWVFVFSTTADVNLSCPSTWLASIHSGLLPAFTMYETERLVGFPSVNTPWNFGLALALTRSITTPVIKLSLDGDKNHEISSPALILLMLIISRWCYVVEDKANLTKITDAVKKIRRR